MIKKHFLSLLTLSAVAATAFAQVSRTFTLDSIPISWTVTANGAALTITPYASPRQHLGYTTVAEGSQLVFTPSAQNSLIESVRLIKRVGQTILLNQISGNIVAQDGDTLRGTLDGSTQTYKITIASGATVVLDGVTISGSNSPSCDWAGINCEGDATLVLRDGTTNSVRGFYYTFPGIHVAEGHTLTICGSGSLTVRSNGFGAGYEMACGDIVIMGGTINATGGQYSSAIGGSYHAACGNITITGGTISATAGYYAPGIGRGTGGTCGDITITSDVVHVTATKGEHADYSIGTSDGGTVTIGNEVGPKSANPYTYNGNGTGSGTGTGSTIQDNTPDTIDAQQQPSASWTVTMPSSNCNLTVSTLNLTSLSLHVNNSLWGSLSVKGVSNSEELMEEFITESDDTLFFESEHFVIMGNSTDEDGLYIDVDNSSKVKIIAKNGEIISRVKMEIGYIDEWEDHYLVTSSGSVSGTYEYGDTISFDNINDNFLTIQTDGDPESFGFLQGIVWHIYYTTTRLPDSVYATQTEGVYAVVPGKQVVLQATPNIFHHLQSWSNGAALNLHRTTTIAVTSDTAITASFGCDSLHLYWRFIRHSFIDMLHEGLTFYDGFVGDSLENIGLRNKNRDIKIAEQMYDREMVRYGSTNPAVASFSGSDVVVNGIGSCILYAVHDGSVFAYDSVAFPFSIVEPATLSLSSNNEEWGFATLVLDSIATSYEWIFADEIDGNGVSEGDHFYLTSTGDVDLEEEEAFIGRHDTINISSYNGEIISRVLIVNYNVENWDDYSIVASKGNVRASSGYDTVVIDNVNAATLQLTVVGEDNPEARIELRYFRIFYYSHLHVAEADNVFRVVPGTELTVKGTPSSDCYFLADWSDNAEVNAEGLNTFSMTDSKILTAIFSAHSYAGDTTATAIDSFTWHGITYTSTPEEDPSYTTTNAAGCDSIVTLHLTIGTNDISSIGSSYASLAVFPNPAVGGQQVRITLNGITDLQGALLAIYDLQGRSVGNHVFGNMNPENQTSSFNIQTSNLTTGLYTLRLTLANGTQSVSRLIVK